MNSNKINTPRKIKICYLTSVDITLRFILLNHMKFLMQQGYDISAVCSPGKWLKDVEAAGIKVKTIKLKRKISPLSDLVAFFKIYFYFKKEKFDIVHTHTPKPEIYGQIAAKLAGVPIIINTLHGLDLPADVSFLGSIFIFLEKIAGRCSDLVFSVNKKNIKIVVENKICASSIVKYFGNGIDTQRFNPNRFSKEFILNKKKQLGIDPSKKIIGIVARLVEEKGYLDLFSAFKVVLERFQDATLLIVGPLEPEKKDAINLDIVKDYGIEKNIIFLGERADADEIYPLMDIFVLPSHREGLPYTILEASATEKPIITTDVGGCPEAVDNKKTGLLVPSKKPEDLAKAIIYFLSNLQEAKKIGKEGRKKILEEFDEKIVFNRLKIEYQRLIKEKINFSYKVCCVVSVDITLKFMLFNQLKFLMQQGYDISAVCSPGKWLKDVEAAGIKVKTIKLKRKISPLSDLVAFFKIYFYFKKEKFDIVHTHTPKPEIYGQIAAKLAGVPIIINTLHGLDLPADVSFLGSIFIFLEKIAGRCSDLVFSISNAVIKTAIEKKTCQPRLLKYLGRDIDTERFNSNKFSRDFIIQKKKELGIPLDKKIIGIVARLVAEKGYLDLFAAFKKVIAKFPNTALLIVGQEEPEKKNAIKIGIVKEYGIENNTIFLGERINAEELYSLMDIFVLPSHREGLGAAILEASSMEKPAIAANTGGCPEAIDNGKTGILVPVKDVEKLSLAIIYLLSNPEKAKEMGKCGREKILKEFNEDIVFNILKKEYSRLINEKLLKPKKKIAYYIRQNIKKIFDFLVSLLALIILSPVFLLMAILIKLDSKGPIIFKQKRLGEGGKVFKVWKFRTMIENAENIGLGLASSENDPRVTRVGKFLREWTFDEWPQLINIVRGEMSLVGPRPLPKYPNQDDFFNELWQKRLLVKPGLICLVDIRGRGFVSWEKRLEYDAWYVDNWSLWIDLKILILGFFAVLSRKGVYGKDGENKPPEK